MPSTEDYFKGMAFSVGTAVIVQGASHALSGRNVITGKPSVNSQINAAQAEAIAEGQKTPYPGMLSDDELDAALDASLSQKRADNVNSFLESKTSGEYLPNEVGFGSMMDVGEAARYAKYWQNYAPKEGIPNTRLDWLRESGRTGRMEYSRVIYDNCGRQIYRVDFSNHMRPFEHSIPHLHQYQYGNGFSINDKETLYNFW